MGKKAKAKKNKDKMFDKGNPKQGNKGQGNKKGGVNAPTSKKK
jgi:hypothetical protein